MVTFEVLQYTKNYAAWLSFYRHQVSPTTYNWLGQWTGPGAMIKLSVRIPMVVQTSEVKITRLINPIVKIDSSSHL